EYAHSQTGVDIHPGASIDESFFIDHGTGVVIGETTIIGKKVRVYQGVTLGALSIKKLEDGSFDLKTKRHPTIEDEAILYSNCTILGGKTVIGKKAVIGGNVWVTESVPPGSVILIKNGNETRMKRG
ncbi:MAG: serine acetyltransferase, partial [Candidatus Muiribacteriota bacterium]